MGQGHYTALGFGVLNPNGLPDDYNDSKRYLDYRNALDKAAGRRVRRSYESECDYLAILVAENAGVEDATVVPQTCLLIDAAKGPAWTKARKAWERVRKASAKLGVELPEGESLLIVDFD